MVFSNDKWMYLNVNVRFYESTEVQNTFFLLQLYEKNVI